MNAPTSFIIYHSAHERVYKVVSCNNSKTREKLLIPPAVVLIQSVIGFMCIMGRMSINCALQCKITSQIFKKVTSVLFPTERKKV